MKDLFGKIKKIDWVTFIEAFLLVMLVVTPSAVSFLGAKLQIFKYILPVLLLYIPFIILVLFFEKKSSISIVPFLLFFVVSLYFLLMYFLHRYYDIYSDKDFGIFKIITGYSSFFIVLFFSIKYKAKSIIYAICVSGFLVLVISILSMITTTNASEDYDMNFGYKALFSALCFISMIYFSEKLVLRIFYLFAALVSIVLLIIFGSRGPLISLLLFLFAYYNLF